MDQTSLIKIFNKMWPDIILANSRIDKVKIFEKCPKYSIRINKGIIAKGISSGKNKEK
jgi:hypothetical protein